MKDTLSEREQKYYLAVFKSTGTMELYCENTVKLFQFADVHCKTSNESNAEHRQWCDEITFVYGGSGEIIHNDKKYRIESGQIHLCFKGDRHRIIPGKSSPLRFYCIGFTFDKSNPLFKLRNEVYRRTLNGKNTVFGGFSELQTAFQSVLSALYDENDAEISTAVITNTLNYIFSAVFSAFLNKNHTNSGNISMKESLLFYIAGYLKNNVYDINALSKLPADTGYSYSYISHLFSEKMHQSLKGFFTALRMDTADELLKTKSVTEVSDLLGYSSLHAFTRAYKSVRGTSPSKGRKTLS